MVAGPAFCGLDLSGGPRHTSEIRMGRLQPDGTATMPVVRSGGEAHANQTVITAPPWSMVRVLTVLATHFGDEGVSEDPQVLNGPSLQPLPKCVANGNGVTPADKYPVGRQLARGHGRPGHQDAGGCQNKGPGDASRRRCNDGVDTGDGEAGCSHAGDPWARRRGRRWPIDRDSSEASCVFNERDIFLQLVLKQAIFKFKPPPDGSVFSEAPGAKQRQRSSPSERRTARQAPSHAPSVSSVAPERLAAPQTRSGRIRRYTIGVTRVIDHTLFD